MAQSRLAEIFIGSSSESLPVVELVTEALAGVAKVTSWTDRSIFRPTHFYAEELLRIPDLFDFGLFLFEPDDIVDSRGFALAAPRDNVVFELGLFMSRLGLKRAFAMGPRGRVRILSDISGLKLIEYDEPAEVTQVRAVLASTKDDGVRTALKDCFKAKIAPALGPALQDLKTLLVEGRLQRPGVSGDAQNVLRVGETIRGLVSEARTLFSTATVRHLALDLSEAWGIICDNVLSRQAEHITWKCLMMNPDSDTIKSLGSYSVSPDVAAARIRQMQEGFGAERERLAQRHVVFECRAYDEPMMEHGFLIDRIALLSSMCDISNGRLEASSTPFWRFEAGDDDTPSSQPARAFRNWFDHRWETARQIWPQ
jgi:predicted nucleotide-binding protein